MITEWWPSPPVGTFSDEATCGSLPVKSSSSSSPRTRSVIWMRHG
ncbi:Uncharacterised protein [Bordetella pertussis]|nr:Uncharacterised protein [Bordetella pertussis]CFW00287.1 Uncharacterised protein [Bordetella pertussis]CFW32725.1 Uncharacterised protein [Bordetella pertussis]